MTIYKLLFITLVLILVIPDDSYGQERTRKEENDFISSNNSWTISYFGRTITHPGAKVSYSCNYLNSKSQNFNATVQPSAGFYYHRSNQTALFITIDFISSVNIGKNKKWFIGLPFRSGIYANFY